MSADLDSGSESQGTTSAEELRAGDTVLIPVVEETTRIEKRAIETGRVRVSTRLDTVEQVLRGTLRSEAVSVTRVPINRTIAGGEGAEPDPLERMGELAPRQGDEA